MASPASLLGVVTASTNYRPTRVDEPAPHNMNLPGTNS